MTVLIDECPPRALKRLLIKHECRTAFFEANEHGGYTVTVPALPGLVTEGRDLERERAMARDAIRSYIESLKQAKEPISLERDSAQVKISVVAYAGPKSPTLAKRRKDEGPSHQIRGEKSHLAQISNFICFSGVYQLSTPSIESSE
jgi:antitoxin HicB